MAELKDLAGVEQPVLLDTFNDANLTHVSKLAKLKEFEVRGEKGEKLSDKRLTHLKGMTSLERLRISLTPDVTAESFAVIGGLKNLRQLELNAANSTQWPPAGVDKLLTLAGQLKTLKLNRSSFSAPPRSRRLTPPGSAQWLSSPGWSRSN